jgi:endonuclease/exonuclease/phosphatase family metal-dependent hydrolase
MPVLLLLVYIGTKWCQNSPPAPSSNVKYPIRNDIHSKMDSAAVETIRIMSFNIRAGINSKSIFNIIKTAASIRKANVSIVGLQECTENGQNGRWVGTTCIAGDENFDKENQTKRLSELTGMEHYEYFGVHNLSRGGTFGVAILSKYTILVRKTHKYNRWKSRDQRGALAVKIDLNEFSKDDNVDQLLGWFVVTHLQNDVTGLEQEDEAEELKQFVIKLKKEDTNVKFTAIMGDFNSTPDFSSVKIISSAFGPSLSAHFNMQNPQENPIQGTFPNPFNTIKMDYIWFYNHDKIAKEIQDDGNKIHDDVHADSCICPVDLKVLSNDEASDHYPVVATFKKYYK